MTERAFHGCHSVAGKVGKWRSRHAVASGVPVRDRPPTAGQLAYRGEEFRVGLAADLFGAREDAAVGVEQHQRAGVVELAVGERAVADAEHAGDRAHVAGGRAASVQRAGSSLRLSATAISAAGVSRFGSMLISRMPRRARSAGVRLFLDRLAAVDDQRADVLARGVEHRHQLRLAAARCASRTCGRPGRSAASAAGRPSRAAAARASARGAASAATPAADRARAG